MTGDRRPPQAGTGADDPAALLAEARGLSEQGHPTALGVWKRLETAVERTGARLSDGERAELLDHRAMERVRTEPAAGAAMFAQAAALFAAAGRAGDAVACHARAALATAFTGDPGQGLATIEPLCAEALSLHRAGHATTRHATAVLLSRARIRGALLGDSGDPRSAAGELDAELTELIAFAGPHREEPGVPARIAEATESRGRLAAQLGDDAASARLLAEAARLYHTAGRPWQATGAELSLSRALLKAGDAAEAEALLRGVLSDPRRAAVLDDRDGARLHLALAEALTEQQRPEEAAACWREAADRAQAAGDERGTGAYARFRLGGSCLDLERYEEAAAVLAAALPGLIERHDEQDVVRARSWLGHALSRTGEPRAAAEQFLTAAGTTVGWENPHDHAMLTHLAADALDGAGSPDEALPVFERAERAWRSLGQMPGAVRCVRSRARLAMVAGERATAMELMAAAVREVESGLRAASEETERVQLCLELGTAYHQTAELLLWTDGSRPGGGQEQAGRTARQEAVVFTDHAIAAFAQAGDAGRHERTGALLSAASLELELGRHRSAAGRARTVLDSYPGGYERAAGRSPDPGGVAGSRRREAAHLLGLAGQEG